MTKSDLIIAWGNAIDSDTFLAPKHDPNNLSVALDKFRTVLSHEASSSLETFIRSGDYTVREFEDKNYSKLYEIIPSENSPFLIAGSGIQSGSIIPSDSRDRLVIVSGSKQGWRGAEDSSIISGSQAKEALI